MTNGDRGMRVVPMVFSPSAEAAAFLILAAREHAQLYRRNGAVVPVGVEEFMAAMTSGVSQGQAGSTPAPMAASEQVVHVTPRLVTYETAAQVLAVSVSTVKRLVRDGVFEPVSLGGSKRIRLADIDTYCSALEAS